MTGRSTIRRTLALSLATLGVMSATFVASTGTAGALEPCPPNQNPFWNGKNCIVQPCYPPYNPGYPPCIMPAPVVPTAPPGIPGSVPGQPF